MWTGPAVSTWFQGDPGVEAMNAAGYSAAALGNHDFDFGLDVLRRHAQESKFPYLAANLVRKSDGQVPDFARPYAILPVNGVRVGLVGLTTVSSPQTTKPTNIAEFDFRPYDETLKKWVPEARAAGADIVIVVGHLCSTEMNSLAPVARQLGVSLITGGHCHERVAAEASGIPLIEGGKYLESYARVDLDVDLAQHKVSDYRQAVIDDAPGPENAGPDAEMQKLVDRWQALVNKELGKQIGYTKTGLGAQSHALYNLVTDAWLSAYPQAQVAMTNLGGFRQGLNPGPIYLRDVVGVLPFDNTLVDTSVTGAQLLADLNCCRERGGRGEEAGRAVASGLRRAA